MNHTSRPAAAVATFALSALPLLFLPSAAAADTTPGATKAGAEHAERLAAEGDRPSKAQIEQRERKGTSGGDQGGSRQQQSPSAPSSSGDTGAAAWQLALSVAFGATLTGGVVLASRQVSHRRRVVAP